MLVKASNKKRNNFGKCNIPKKLVINCAGDVRCSKACGNLAALDLTGTRVDNNELLSFSKLEKFAPFAPWI